MSAGPSLPLDRSWYRELLVVAGVVGAVVAVLGLAYLGVTGALSELVFGAPSAEPWSGQWWWVAYTATGGLVVAGLRRWWRVPDRVPGGVAVIESGVVDHRAAPSWVGIALVSAVVGASLGPSFALVMMGGGLASWIASRRWKGNEEARLEATAAGVAGGFGGAFTSPLLGTIIVSELAPIHRSRYVQAILPQLIAASVGFGIYYAVVGTTFLNSFAIPVDEFTPSQLLVGVALGAASSVVMLSFVVVVKGVDAGAQRLRNPYVRGVVAGGLVGLIAVALPLTVGAGNAQLTAVIDDAASLSVWLLLAVLVGKMVAMALSLATGFIGGNVLPMLFVGGTAGVLVHQAFPGIPYAVAVGCMLAAVPAAAIRAPIGLTAIAALSIGLGPVTLAPVAVAVATSHLITAGLVGVIRRRHAVPDVHA